MTTQKPTRRLLEWAILAMLIAMSYKASVTAFYLSPSPLLLKTTSRQIRGSLDTLFAISDNIWQSNATATSSQDEVISELEETKILVEAQQQKIELLLERLGAKSHSKSVSNKVANGQHSQLLRPLKVMLFIDGTWMYYSAHEREDEFDPIVQRYGRGWQFKYNIDWSSLPRVVCNALQAQDHGWSSIAPRSSNLPPRPIEVARVCVYTSFKADTPKTSFRYKMFQDMLSANYDVTMLETVGKGEKCVDIQLAVDMLHYATITNAYDVALMLSGDKDFVPAMVRCRQKGRKVGLISMRRACNRALIDTPNIKDFDVIWLEDHLDDLIKPRSSGETRSRSPSISEYTLMKILVDYFVAAGVSRISSRDVGRYMKSLEVGSRNVLEEVKETYGGLYQFLVVSDIFLVHKVDRESAFWVTVRENAQDVISEASQRTTLTGDENKFFDRYSLAQLEDKENAYPSTFEEGGFDDEYNVPSWSNNVHDVPTNQFSVPTMDYNTSTLVKLKELCRERGLPVSGKKADLISRLEEHHSQAAQVHTSEPTDPLEYLQGLVLEYLQVKGGQSSSRDVGRYLQANNASPNRSVMNDSERINALAEMKELYGSVKKFATQNPFFDTEEMVSDEAYEFMIKLRT